MKRISLSVDPHLHHILKARAKNNKRSLNAELTLLLESALALDEQYNMDLWRSIIKLEGQTSVA